MSVQFTEQTLNDESLGFFRLAHAGYFVSSKKTKLLLDPIFFNDWLEFLTLNPRVDFNFSQIKNLKPDAVVISHFHNDHFCLRSLNLVSREALIVYPRGCQTIPYWLKMIGFKNFKELGTGEMFKIGDIEIEATISHISGVHEMGMYIQKGKTKVLNLVDTIVSKEDVKDIVRRKGQPSASFCFYQPLRETQVLKRNFSASFPRKKYQSLLEIVEEMPESIIVPSACSWAYKFEPELNHWMFPVTEEKFCHDVKKRFPHTKPKILAPGEGLIFDNGNLRNIQCLSWVKKQEVSKSKKGPIVMRDHGNIKIERREEVTLKLISKLLPKIKSSKSPQKWNYEFLRPKGNSFFVQLNLSPSGNSLKVLERKPANIMSVFTTTAFITAVTEGMLYYPFTHTGQYARLAPATKGEDPLLQVCLADAQKKYLYKLVFFLDS